MKCYHIYSLFKKRQFFSTVNQWGSGSRDRKVVTALDRVYDEIRIMQKLSSLSSCERCVKLHEVFLVRNAHPVQPAPSLLPSQTLGVASKLYLGRAANCNSLYSRADVYSQTVLDYVELGPTMEPKSAPGPCYLPYSAAFPSETEEAGTV